MLSLRQPHGQLNIRIVDKGSRDGLWDRGMKRADHGAIGERAKGI